MSSFMHIHRYHILSTSDLRYKYLLLFLVHLDSIRSRYRDYITFNQSMIYCEITEETEKKRQNSRGIFISEMKGTEIRKYIAEGNPIPLNAIKFTSVLLCSILRSLGIRNKIQATGVAHSLAHLNLVFIL